MSRRIVVLDGYALNPGDLDWSGLQRLGVVEIHDRTDQAQIVETLGDAEIALTNKTPISAETIRQCPRLKYIGVLATGYDCVDTTAATAAGISVTNIPEYGTSSVAQYTIALLLELCHRIQRHDDAVKQGKWSDCPDFSFHLNPLLELDGKTLGIVGMGHIGYRVAKIAGELGMNVVYTSRTKKNFSESFEQVDMDTLFKVSDVVSLHCPLMPETAGLINKRTLGMMKPSALLINTARGKLIVEEDLRQALNEGTIAGAALDVLSTEPPPHSHPLYDASNCIITPHMAWATREARSRLLDTVVDNLQKWLEGTPVNTVNEV